MNLRLKINNSVRELKIVPTPSRIEFSLDGQGIIADIIEVEADIFSVLLDGEVFEVRIWPVQTGVRVRVGGSEYDIEFEDSRQWRRSKSAASRTQGTRTVTAPMPGKIARVLVKSGDRVEAGQGLVIVEAMKMQNEIKSPKEGTVEKIAVAEGVPVNAGEVLAIIS